MPYMEEMNKGELISSVLRCPLSTRGLKFKVKYNADTYPSVVDEG